MIIFVLLSIPLLACGLAFAMRTRQWMETIHLVSAACSFVAALILAGNVLRYGPISASDGFLYADQLSALVALFTAFVYLACAPYAIGYLRRDESAGTLSADHAHLAEMSKLRMFYTLMPLFAFCMFLVVVANNLGVMWIAIEGTTLASIFLVTFYGRPNSLEAAWKYAMIGGVGLSMALFGTVLTYYSAHLVLGGDSVSALNWSVLVLQAPNFDKSVMRLAFILILLGFGTKAGLAPMHTWKPDAYCEAPVPVAALMSTAVVNCAVYGLARFYVLTSRCLGPAFASNLLILFGLLSVGIAVPFIMLQRSSRRMLAYSSIEHGGIMVLGLGFGGVIGVMGMLLHMTFHTVTKPLLFFCVGNIQQHTGNDSRRKGASGLVHVLPISAPLFVLGTLAVTGTPPFSMFQSEFMVLRAGFLSQHVGLSVLFVICITAIFCGFFHHVTQLVFGPPSGVPREVFSRWKTYPVIGLALIVVIIGFWLPAPLYQLVDGAARILAVPQ
ncbi:MAG: hydrogenase 4 subunit F [Formivibrio sp.]|nr:hydrogenase 4 subunit F [Formivibrio sp.]